jgi:hypothetical protein
MPTSPIMTQPIHRYGGDRVFFRIGDGPPGWVREGDSNTRRQLNGEILFRPPQVQRIFKKYPQLDRSLSANCLKFQTTHAVQLGVHHPKGLKGRSYTLAHLHPFYTFLQDAVAIDGHPMCHACLDNEDDVDRMALAQSDSAENCNMEPRWIRDPDLPYDAVDKIKHCVCIMYSTKFIPAGSKLSWYYPMIHHKVLSLPPCAHVFLSSRLCFRILQSSLKGSHLI